MATPHSMSPRPPFPCLAAARSCAQPRPCARSHLFSRDLGAALAPILKLTAVAGGLAALRLCCAPQGSVWGVRLAAFCGQGLCCPCERPARSHVSGEETVADPRGLPAGPEVSPEPREARCGFEEHLQPGSGPRGRREHSWPAGCRRLRGKLWYCF